MSGTASTRWCFTDWMSDPNVRACSLAARGLWMDLLCVAGANREREHGFVLVAGRVPSSTEVARLVGSSVGEVDSLLAELETNGVFSRDRRRAIYCRRMVRAEKNRGNGRLGGNPNLLKTKEDKKSVRVEANPQANPFARDPLPLSPPPSFPSPAPPPITTPSPLPRSPSSPSAKSRPAKASDWPSDCREQFWANYPRKTEKKAAMAKLDALRLSGAVPWAVFFAGVLRYAAHVAGTEERYVKHPTTWLNRGCWDDVNAPRSASAGRTTFGFAALAAQFQQEEDDDDDDRDHGPRHDAGEDARLVFGSLPGSGRSGR